MIIGLDDTKIVIGATGAGRIIQQIRTVLKSVKCSVPFDRGFGIDFSFIDKPLPVAKVLAISNVIDEVEKQVPGVKVKNVSFKNDNELIEGILKPIVEIEIES
ncbi:MAG: hypothetical protein GY714_12140 [Desulfobacterales bacterium]|nr:hypothetical protein [Desulfobacterales bacterium]